jgi:hypothetical protein
MIHFYSPLPRDRNRELRLPPRAARPSARDASPPPEPSSPPPGTPPRHWSPHPHRRCPFLCRGNPPTSPPDPILTWATSVLRSAAGVRPITGAIHPLRRTTSCNMSMCFHPQSAQPSLPTLRGHQTPSGKLVGPAASNARRSQWPRSKLTDPCQSPLLSLSPSSSHPPSLRPKRSPLPAAASPS